MKTLAFAALSLILIGATVYFNQPVDNAEKLINYIEYLEKFHKPIPAFNEMKYRLEIFSKFIETMQKHNSDPSKSWKMAINQFSDLTKEEFVNLYLDTHSAPSIVQDYQKEITEPVPTVDWRSKGFITPVKNQAKCGSCWAFAATAAHEAFQSSKQRRNISLSEQQLVDCSGDYGNQGCNGGLGLEALNYIRDFGQTLNASYPYTAQNGDCRKKEGQFKIQGVVSVKGCDEIARYITRTPMAVRVDATNWHSYGSGIFDTCDSRWNHAVFMVGSSPDFWIIKNSWSTSWGEDGFIRLKMGDTCGVCYGPSFPI